MNQNIKNNKLYYFGYGSNIHPRRLQERAASARFIGGARLDGYAFNFSKISDDTRGGSGKGNIVKSDSACVYGAVYAMNCGDKDLLTEIEQGYKIKRIAVTCNNKNYKCFTYVATPATELKPPYDWYKELILVGAEFAQFPADYVAYIKSFPSRDDPCETRASENAKRIAAMREYNLKHSPCCFVL